MPSAYLSEQPVSHGEQHRRRGVVFRSDEFQLTPLGLQLTDDGVGHLWFGGGDDLEGRSIGGRYGRFGHGVLLRTTSGVRPGARLCPACCRRVDPRWCSTLTPVTTPSNDSPNALPGHRGPSRRCPLADPPWARIVRVEQCLSAEVLAASYGLEPISLAPPASSCERLGGVLSASVALACCRRSGDSNPNDLYPDADAAPLRAALHQLGADSTLMFWG